MMMKNGSMITKPKKTFVVGDIHGALNALKQCLGRSEYNPEEDQLIFLGDYTDGWSDNAGVVEFLYWFGAATKFKPIFLKGNHDQWVKSWLNKGITNEVWLMNGGRGTIRDYIKTGNVSKHTHREFFNNLLEFYIDRDNRAFVHAGFCSNKGLGYEFCNSEYSWDRTLWSEAVREHGRQGSDKHRSYVYNELYIGHTPTPNYSYYDLKEASINNAKIGDDINVPMNRLNVWNIDTGAGWPDGKLTIMDIDSKQFWQSDIVDTLYPGEKPR